MSPSRPFILRPVATTLLMVAILLSGIIAYRFLPLAALPEVDYPTIQVATFYPGASPDVMTSSVTAPLEVQLGQMPALNQMSSASSAGSSVITLQFNLKLSLDVAEQEVQAAINAAGNLLPSDLPAPPIYAKVNPADAPILTLALKSDSHAAAAGRGPRRHAAGDEDFAVARRRARQHQRRPAAGGAHPGRSSQARGLWAEHRRPAHHARQRQRQHAEGQFRRPDARVDHQCQRPADERGRLPQSHHRLPQRLAGAPERRRQRDRRGAERQACGMDEPVARGHSQRPAPARRQRHRGGRQHQGAAAAAAGVAPRRGRRVRAQRPHGDHPRLRRGRRVRADARRDAGGAGDLRVPAQRPGDHHSEPVGAAVAGRYFRRDVSDGLQPQQSVADGADDLLGLRRRRRHRRDREHLALHRGGRIAARGGAQGLRADRLHHHLADDLADRGADSAAVHG